MDEMIVSVNNKYAYAFSIKTVHDTQKIITFLKSAQRCNLKTRKRIKTSKLKLSCVI